MIARGHGRLTVRAEYRRVGADLLVTISGGDRPHIGAAALAGPDAPPAAVTLAGHRETQLALEAAEHLRGILLGAVLVSCGIHVDDADREQIRILCENTRELIGALAEELSREGPAPLPGTGTPISSSEEADTLGIQ